MRFFLIDKITRWNVGSDAEAVKNVTLSEDFFDDHFPRRPVMPGVLMIEGMAQLSGLLLEASLAKKSGHDAKAVLTVLERTEFRKPVGPGDVLTYRASVIAVNKNGGKASAETLCDGQVVRHCAQSYRRSPRQEPGEPAHPIENRSIQPTRDRHLVQLGRDVPGVTRHLCADLDQLLAQSRRAGISVRCSALVRSAHLDCLFRGS